MNLYKIISKFCNFLYFIDFSILIFSWFVEPSQEKNISDARSKVQWGTGLVPFITELQYCFKMDPITIFFGWEWEGVYLIVHCTLQWVWIVLYEIKDGEKA